MPENNIGGQSEEGEYVEAISSHQEEQMQALSPDESPFQQPLERPSRVRKAPNKFTYDVLGEPAYVNTIQNGPLMYKNRMMPNYYTRPDQGNTMKPYYESSMPFYSETGQTHSMPNYLPTYVPHYGMWRPYSHMNPHHTEYPMY